MCDIVNIYRRRTGMTERLFEELRVRSVNHKAIICCMSAIGNFDCYGQIWSHLADNVSDSYINFDISTWKGKVYTCLNWWVGWS